MFERVEGEKREKTGQHLTSRSVDFRLSFDGIPTYGPGAKIKVLIGHRGEVLGLFHSAPSARRLADYPVRSREEWEHILPRKLGLPLTEIEVRKTELIYDVHSLVSEQRYIQPAYVFELATTTRGKGREELTAVTFTTHPLPATTFAPIAMISPARRSTLITQGETLTLACDIEGGTPPFRISWESNIDGDLGGDAVLQTRRLSVAHRGQRLTSHTIKVTVTDLNGMQDTHHALVKVVPKQRGKILEEVQPEGQDPDDPAVGVEWCNIYHGTPGLPDISGTDASARGFNELIRSLPGWSSRFNWGNDAAWEEDFKFVTAPGGGTDPYWADNTDFAFFAGHGSSGAFYFGSTVDDHQMVAQDAHWGDGLLNWIVLHACETMRANFEWNIWCDSSKGLHQMFGFHTVTEGSTPPLGSRFAYWMTFRPSPGSDAFDMQTAWKLACTECFDSSVEYALIDANQSGTDTHNDHLPGYGHVSGDPTAPTSWSYSRGTC